MRKFESIYHKLLQEASPPPPEDIDDEEDSGSGPINFDSGDDADLAMDDQSLPSDAESPEGPAASQASNINTPQDLELLALAINALQFSGDVNLKIYDHFEEGRGNNKNILDYIESKVGAVDLVEDDIASFGFEGDLDVNKTNGKSIGKKLNYYKNFSDFSDQQESFWVRLILNCLKYDGQNYNLSLSELTPESSNEIFSKIKQDFNYDTRGMFDALVKDKTTGSSLKGPGVF